MLLETIQERCTSRQAEAVLWRFNHQLTLSRIAELMHNSPRAVRYLLRGAAGRLKGAGVFLPKFASGRRPSAAKPYSQIASNRFANDPDIDHL